jgi:hypothetical protein
MPMKIKVNHAVTYFKVVKRIVSILSKKDKQRTTTVRS